MDRINVLGVDYTHLTTADGGDLYVTGFGKHLIQHLLPENWFADQWFSGHREKLEGSSTVYKVRTREVNGRSLDIVVKWCRVGTEVPFDTITLNKFAQAEFNSPYEEFAMVMEMRRLKAPGTIRTHKPLAIYAPPERLHLWQTGRLESKIAHKAAKHRDVELDVYRHYILIYQWIEGASVVEILEQTDIPKEQHPEIMKDLTNRAISELGQRGFRVIDMKPAHIIVRTTSDRKLMTGRSKEVAYALVDFELLERTPEHEQVVKVARRGEYLKGQSKRFGQIPAEAFPPHLHPVSVFGIDYVFGHTESTHGVLWVAGKLPELFDFFLPERWRRTNRIALSTSSEVYYTKTKDNINVVWRVSRVGERPDIDPSHPNASRILQHGYNSPFEQFKLAIELGKKGIPTVYPRAIYMTGLEFDSATYIEDQTRYRSHASIRCPDGSPVLNEHRNYITIWGFWNGLDEMLADSDRPYCEGLSLNMACQRGYISRNDAAALQEVAASKLRDAGVEDLNLKGGHILLSIDSNGMILRSPDNLPEIRFCNFALMTRI